MERKNNIVRLTTFYILVIVLFMVGTWLGDRTISVFSRQVITKTRHCIVVDAGHGGEDGGAVSCTGKNESEYNLEIAQRTNAMLRLLGYKTRMIRENDNSIFTEGKTVAQRKASDLRERARIINTTCNAILLSIHQNYYQEEKYSGAQVFYHKGDESRELASQVQKNLREVLNKNNCRQVKPADGIYIMEQTQCTGILVECGFISNYSEEIMLATPIYQKKIAATLAVTLAEYLVPS